jgi:hypothetical protein
LAAIRGSDFGYRPSVAVPEEARDCRDCLLRREPFGIEDEVRSRDRGHIVLA